MGKNTMMKKIIQDRVAADPSETNKLFQQKLVTEKLIQSNVGLIFTNGDLSEVRDIIHSNRIQAPARAGAIAPVGVTVPAGNTGMEPTKTPFFQALSIGTKITKG
eukprot:459039_1